MAFGDYNPYGDYDDETACQPPPAKLARPRPTTVENLRMTPKNPGAGPSSYRPQHRGPSSSAYGPPPLAHRQARPPPPPPLPSQFRQTPFQQRNKEQAASRRKTSEPRKVCMTCQANGADSWVFEKHLDRNPNCKLCGKPWTTAAAAPEKRKHADVSGATDVVDDSVDDDSNPCAVQLRGLPFRASVADIKTFLGGHLDNLTDTGEHPISMLLNRDGRPSGFATVQFIDAEAAKACREDLHRQQMDDRYIEVLACTNRSGKTRHRRAAENPQNDEHTTSDSAFEAPERELVLQECRDHMRVPGRGTLLLSMLGIALSPTARAYLRKANLGFKHFLARFPNEFRVEGPKGCERVVWSGAGAAASPSAEALPEVSEDELFELKTSELQKRARVMGVAQDRLDEALDSEDTKEALIQAILEKANHGF